MTMPRATQAWAILFWVVLLPVGICAAQENSQAARAAPSKVMGQINFVPATKIERNAGIWIDGQYVGYVGELKGDKKIVLLPGEHEITARQSGYQDLTQKIIVEPGSIRDLSVKMERDPREHEPDVTAEIKIKVTPDRAAVFLDGTFVGYVHEFGGTGRSMLLAPGKHQIKIALPGYKDFTTQVSLIANQKFTLKTDLVQASITEADPAVKKE
jgi:PEGA domain